MSSVEERALEPIQRTPLIDEVVVRLRELIESSRYAPGDRLPSERSLSEDLRVGRSTIREALRTLEALGLIELRQGRGAFVSAKDPAADDRPPFADWPSSYRWRIADVIEARVELESGTAALAAGRRREENLRRMRAALDEFDHASARRDLSALVLADVAFHDAIAECANPVLASLLRSMRSQGIRSRSTSLRRRERWASVRERHEAIYEAIAARDPEQAAKRMESHLLDFARELGVKVSAPAARQRRG
jgi:GntR family transcriptional regulator, transcriptional repressor for pyruvate dehydrogenase complex